MTRVIEWIISLVIVIALFVAIGLFLPSTRTVSHSVETNRPMSTVNDILNGFTRFKDWNALINYDPRMTLTTSGPETGVGAKLDFVSQQATVGEGSWEIVESEPGEKIVYALQTPGRGENKRMTIRFERTGQRNQNVKITQRYTVDYGYDLFGRYAGLYVTDKIGDDMKRGLEKLSNLLTTIPRFDYSQHEPGFEFVDLPAVNALVVTTAAKRANDDIALAMTNQDKWIEQVMEKNGLEPAGPMRIVTNEFTTDTYGFDVVQPIRKKGTGPAPAADEGSEGEGNEPAADAADAAPVATAPVDPNAPLERYLVKVEGPVLYVQYPAIRAAKTSYTGPSPGLPRVRDLVRAWSMVRGAEPVDRPYEEYLDAIKDMLSEEAEFNVYWPVRVPGVEAADPVQIAPEPAAETPEGEAAPADAEAPADAAPAEAPAAA
ncbi:SRPBCC family protein [Arenimonas sp. MALMAid1274]|uniref:SRPBCC family protein n=1 Tax=Arenimonas sp. MALMAid1274 TaxID=3411630 RepID=UPI003BA2B795